MTNEPAATDVGQGEHAGVPETSSPDLLQRLVDEYREVAAARSVEITRLVLEVQRLEVLVGSRGAVDAADVVDIPLMAGDMTSQERELGRLRALARRKSVRVILRLDHLMGKRDPLVEGGRRAVR